MDEEIIEAAAVAVYGKGAHLKVRRATSAIPTCTVSVIEGGAILESASAPLEDQAMVKLSRMIIGAAGPSERDHADLAKLQEALRMHAAREDPEEDSDDEDLFDSHDEDEEHGGDDEGWDEDDDF